MSWLDGPLPDPDDLDKLDGNDPHDPRNADELPAAIAGLAATMAPIGRVYVESMRMLKAEGLSDDQAFQVFHVFVQNALNS